MNELLSWGVRDYLTFRDTDIELSADHGFYVVHGENRDSRISGNSNAIGKSRLLSAIPTVFYDCDPMSITKNNKKEVLRAKSSKTEIVMRSHSGVVTKIQQTPSKYFIGEQQADGDFKDLKAIKQAVAKDLIVKVFPIPQKTFYSTVYVQSQRDCAFQRTNARGRLDFITEVFGLDIYDKIRKDMSSQLSSLVKAETEFELVAKTLREAEVEHERLLSESDPSSNIDKVQLKVERAQKKLKKLYTQKGAIEQTLQRLEKLASLYLKQKEAERSLSKFSIPSDTVKSTVKQLKEMLELSAEYSRYKDRLADYKDQASEYTAALDKLPKVKGDPEKLFAEYKNLKSTISKLEIEYSRASDLHDSYESEIAEYNEQASALAELNSNIRECSLYKSLKLAKLEPSEWRDAVKTLASSAQTTITLWNKLSSHKHLEGCPVCGADDISFNDLKSRAKKAETIVDEYQMFVDYHRMASSIINKPVKPASLKSIKKKLESAQSEAKALRKKCEALDDRKHFERLLSKLKKPKSVDKPALSKSDIVARLEALETFSSIQDRIKDFLGNASSEPASAKQLEKNLKSIAREIKSIEESNAKLQKQLDKHRLHKLNIKQQRMIIKTSRARLAEIGDVANEQKILRTLVDAYNPKNLKLQAAENILSIIEDSLNKYSNLVFLEPMRFEIRSQKDGISAVAIRNNGERSDIIYLSGAESNCFRLLFAVSLLPLLPESQRANFLVLDEPDSACSPAWRSHLIREFVPKIRAIVPHVFWITPDTIDEFENCTVLKIIKEDGVSRLEV